MTTERRHAHRTTSPKGSEVPAGCTRATTLILLACVIIIAVAGTIAAVRAVL